MALAGWIGDHGDPDNYFSFIFASSNIGATNLLYYSNPDVDRLIAEARTQTQQEKREVDYLSIQKQIAEDVPWLPIAHARQVIGVHPKLEAFEIHPTGVLLLHKLRWGTP